jgi:thiamine-monophosphate kinase
VARGRLADSSGHLLGRYRLPQPRIGLGIAGIATAGMDVSDGLVQDLGHICRASGLAAVIDASAVPLSDAARAAGPDWLETCLTGGDDYELLLAVPTDREAALQAEAKRADIAVTRIGHLRDGAAEVTVLGSDGAALRFDRPGWSHF